MCSYSTNLMPRKRERAARSSGRATDQRPLLAELGAAHRPRHREARADQDRRVDRRRASCRGSGARRRRSRGGWRGTRRRRRRARRRGGSRWRGRSTSRACPTRTADAACRSGARGGARGPVAHRLPRPPVAVVMPPARRGAGAARRSHRAPVPAPRLDVVRVARHRRHGEVVVRRRRAVCHSRVAPPHGLAGAGAPREERVEQVDRHDEEGDPHDATSRSSRSGGRSGTAGR